MSLQEPEAADLAAGQPDRDQAPPYAGEGEFALWHFSEDPDLLEFRPRAPQASPDAARLVWAVDTRHAPLFWFPRDCPRGSIWAGPATTTQDLERFFGQSGATRVHVTECGWADRMQACRLYAYRLPADSFRPHATGGYWVSSEPVEAAGQVVIEDLIGCHAEAGIELRITPSLWPFWRRVIASTVEYSGSRLRNAAPHQDQIG